ncbi:hypothetical protein [Streptomyces sp. V3I7]|uniref:hypothetical protein n=1 Tax=Streptomyces sp. V3I7 TaxID=3042278 RepID=UPI0027814C16|nr:hypothetical protein [Streptomyces sp. V3I7]MDQ0991195.1 hypothetical protein [Streptomyces sp. V3I7]
MRGVGEIGRRGMVAVAVLAGVLAAAGCGAQNPPKEQGPSKSRAGGLRWEFAHIADFSGELTDVAALAEEDIWATGVEHNGGAAVRLLHFDGERWRPEPLPEALGATAYPPLLEEVGDEDVWMRPRTLPEGTRTVPWLRWDGTHWSPVPNPPPDRSGYLKAAAPDDIWALADERTAHHWDGTRWTTTRLPSPAVDLAVVGPDDAWAVGSRSTGPGTELGYGERYSQPLSMHWDGVSWKAVETPQVHFEKPYPPEPGAGLSRVVALAGGEVRAYGSNGFNHGEVEDEPEDQPIRLRWDGSRWVEQRPAPGQCAQRIPIGQDTGGLFLDGNWYLTDDGRCVKIKRRRLPLSTGARKESNQSLWLTEIHRIPGTDEWLGAGHVQVNQSGDPFSAPVVVRLKRGG